VSIDLDTGQKCTKEIFDRSKFKVTRDISPTISGWLLVRTFSALCSTGTGPSEGECAGATARPAVSLEEQYAERAVKADRYDPAALVNKGNVLLAVRGDVERARELYREALLSDASCVEATYNLALVYKRLQRYTDALQCFSKLNIVLRNDPQVHKQNRYNCAPTPTKNLRGGNVAVKFSMGRDFTVNICRWETFYGKNPPPGVL